MHMFKASMCHKYHEIYPNQKIEQNDDSIYNINSSATKLMLYDRKLMWM